MTLNSRVLFKSISAQSLPLPKGFTTQPSLTWKPIVILRGLAQCNLGWERGLVSLYWSNRCYLFRGQVQKFWKIITLRGGKITVPGIKFLMSEIYRHNLFIVLRFIAFHSCWLFHKAKGRPSSSTLLWYWLCDGLGRNLQHLQVMPVITFLSVAYSSIFTPHPYYS